MAITVPQFRYLADYKEFLKETMTQVDELTQLVDQQQKLLASTFNVSVSAKLQHIAAAATTIINLTPNTKEQQSRLRKLQKKLDVEAVDVVVPNKKALEDQYTIAEALYERYRTLESMESQIEMQFPEASADGIKREIASAKKKISNSLSKCLTFLSDVAEQHVPKEFKKYMQAVSDEVDTHIAATDVKNMLYVSVFNGSLVFTYYKLIEDAINEDGSITPSIYAVVQWVVGSRDQDSAVYVYLEHEFTIPNKLLKVGGHEVDSALEAVKKIGDLLRLEHFTSELGVIPLSLAFLKEPDLIDKTLFNEADLIKSMEVAPREITFQFKREVPSSDVQELAKQLYPQIAKLLRRSRTVRLDYRFDSRARTATYTSVGAAQAQDVTLEDAEFLKDRFNLNDQQLNKVVQILNEKSS